MKILLVGDSNSAGDGFTDPTGKVWHSLLDSKHTVTNLSVGGQSNQKILNKACTELFQNPSYDLIVLQYTSLFRLNFNNSKTVYENPENIVVSKYSTGEIPPIRETPSTLKEFHKVWIKNYLHGRIEITEYLTQIIIASKLFRNTGLPFIFIKYFDNFFLDLEKNDWRQTSDAFQTIVLCKDQLPDWEITKIYVELRNLYLLMVEESQNNWLNLIDSAFIDIAVDTNEDNCHPGVLSNQIYYQKFLNFSETIGLSL